LSELQKPVVPVRAWRAWHVVLALMIGGACAVGAYFVTTYTAVVHSPRTASFMTSSAGWADRFVWSMTVLFGAVGVVVTLGIARARATRSQR
jgi:spore maturation protein SpmB